MSQFREKLDKNKTPAELVLLKAVTEHFKEESKNYKFPLIKTQTIIGWYIVDFCFPHKHLIVELDGSQHYTPDGLADDYIRDEYLRSLGFDVLRYKNVSVYKDIKNIIDYIDLWASLEDYRDNYWTFVKIIKKQRKLRATGKLKRPERSSDMR